MKADLCVEVPAVPTFRIRWSDAPWEAEQAYQLRRTVFCDEQGIFNGDDRDAVDDVAQLLVAVLNHPDDAHKPGTVVGTVRIHESEPGVWFGSRLAVHDAFRGHGKIGASLIRLAVSSAHALGCQRFLAHVQSQNAPLFRRLHWSVLSEETLLGRPHYLMQADLNQYPPCHTPRTGFLAEGRSQR